MFDRLTITRLQDLPGDGVKPAKIVVANQQAELETALNAIPDLLFEVDLEGIFYSYRGHPSNTQIVSPEEFIGKRLSDVLPRDAAAACMAALGQANSVQFAGGPSVGTTITAHVPAGAV